MIGWSALVGSILVAIAPVRLCGQEIDPYQRLSDPRGIARLLEPNSHILRNSSNVNYYSYEKDIDGYLIIAQDTGAGVITHIWLQLHDQPDSATGIKIWVDDSLLISSHLYSFFSKAHGALSPPLDTLESGALDAEIQIGYHHSFRITYYFTQSDCCLDWSIEWRPLNDTSLLEVFSLNPSPSYIANTDRASAAFSLAAYAPPLTSSEASSLDAGQTDAAHLLFSPWKGEPCQTINQTTDIPPGAEVTMADISGPGMIKALHFKPSTFDPATLRGLSLKIFWDGSPYPAVEVPLTDFFGVSNRVDTIKSYPIRTSPEEGFISYFPMPFRTHTKITLANTGPDPVSIISQTCYSSENVNIDSLGYFFAQFNESNRTQYHTYHHVANALGRGRFVGVLLAVPDTYEPYFLEGNPYLDIDGDFGNQISYTGTEDYCDGGWFYDDGSFSLPFAGCPDLWHFMYRFHYLDAVDFNRSFNFNWQHGVDNDYQADYRTVAFLYEHWIPFWTTADTIRAGQHWVISGTGYRPNSQIQGQLGNTGIFQTLADSAGGFSQPFIVPQSWQAGLAILSVNGESQPKPICILNSPVVWHPTDSLPKDSLPGVLRVGDSILIHCAGFSPNEQIEFMLDSALLDSIRIGLPQFAPTRSHWINTDSNGSANLWVYLPGMAGGGHVLRCLGMAGEVAEDNTPIQTVPSLNFEFENLWPPLHASTTASRTYLGYYTESNPVRYWSNQNMVFLWSMGPDSSIAFSINLPFAGTFGVQLFATTGFRYGAYRIVLDSSIVDSFSFFAPGDFNYPNRTGPFGLGIHNLARGTHSIEFISLNKPDSAAENDLGVDNLVLVPVGSTSVSPSESAPSCVFSVFPNPASDDCSVWLDSYESANRGSMRIDLDLYDAIGRRIAQLYHGTPTSQLISIKSQIASICSGAYFIAGTVKTDGSSLTQVHGLRIVR